MSGPEASHVQQSRPCLTPPAHSALWSVPRSPCDRRRDLPLAQLSPSTPCEGLQMWALGSQPCTRPLRLQALSVSSPDSQGSALGPPSQFPTPLTGPPRLPNPKLRSPHAYPVPHWLPIHLHSNCTVGPQFGIDRRHQNPVPRPLSGGLHPPLPLGPEVGNCGTEELREPRCGPVCWSASPPANPGADGHPCMPGTALPHPGSGGLGPFSRMSCSQ